jgi:hypothetical protein
MQKNCVIVQHVENGDWALVLIAERSEYGRRSIIPLIFVNDGCGVFATAPQLKHWQKSGLVAIFTPPPDRREEMLTNAVNEWIRTVSQHSFICERSKVGIVARAKARNEQIVPPTNFELSREKEPALFWLCDRSETALQAVKVLSYLINKNKIGELSQQEREAIGLRLITRGETLKNVNAPTIWRR